MKTLNKIKVTLSTHNKRHNDLGPQLSLSFFFSAMGGHSEKKECLEKRTNSNEDLFFLQCRNNTAMQTPQQASVFRSVESMLCTNYSDEDCTNKTNNEFHDYVTYLALKTNFLSETYDLLSTCAPCIEKTFLIQPWHTIATRRSWILLLLAATIKPCKESHYDIQHDFSSPDDTSYAFENV